MKAKKALKKLDKVESLLASIIDQYDTDGGRSLQETLASAKESVIRARETVDQHQAEAKAAKKPAAKAAASQAVMGSRGRRRVRTAAAGQ